MERSEAAVQNSGDGRVMASLAANCLTENEVPHTIQAKTGSGMRFLGPGKREAPHACVSFDSSLRSL